MQCIKGYRIPFTFPPSQQSVPPEPTFSEADFSELRCALNRLQDLAAIEPCTPCEGQFVSTYFLVDKSNGEKRFILNLKKLNKFIKAPHFKLEDIRTAVKLISPGCFMGKIDLKDTYFLVPVRQQDRKFLRFLFQGKCYQFTCMPFGLSTSPFAFTKLMKPVVHHLRSKGLISSIYLDDLLCIGPSQEKCQTNIRTTIALLSRLGFIINWEKSQLTPATRCEYLGLILDSRTFTLELPAKKQLATKDMIKRFQPRTRCSIRSFASFIGTLISCCPAVAYGFLYTRNLEKEKQLRLILNDGDFEAWMTVPRSIQQDIEWWEKHIMSTHSPIRTKNFNTTIFTDASLTGWGAACGDKSTGGLWSEIERSNHINYLELLAIYLALMCFAKKLSNCEILLRVDNTTAISYINRMGGTRVSHLNRLARQIWQCCESRNLWLFASYIPSSENTITNPDITTLILNGSLLTMPLIV